MPRSSSGKWVARAGATGGGRTYRGQVPGNWYAVLVLIVVLGLGSVVFARYEYQNPTSTADTVAPTKGTQWFAAMVFDICGTQSTLASNEISPTKQSFVTTGNGVIVVAPKTTADAGNNAVLGKFLASYKGLELTSSTIKLPSTALATSATTSPTTPATSTTTTTPSSTTTSTTAAGSTTTTAPSGAKRRSSKTKKKTSSAAASKGSTTTTTAPKAPPAKVYRTGGTCPAGTKDAGKKGVVQAVYWPSAFAAKAKPVHVTGSPTAIKFSADQLITIGFVPKGTALPKPNGTVVTALLGASTGASSTTSTTAPASSTSTTAAGATTTSTTAAGSTTTTTSPAK